MFSFGVCNYAAEANYSAVVADLLTAAEVRAQRDYNEEKHLTDTFRAKDAFSHQTYCTSQERYRLRPQARRVLKTNSALLDHWVHVAKLLTPAPRRLTIEVFSMECWDAVEVRI